MRQGPSLKVYCVIDKFLNRLLITFYLFIKTVSQSDVGPSRWARMGPTVHPTERRMKH